MHACYLKLVDICRMSLITWASNSCHGAIASFTPASASFTLGRLVLVVRFVRLRHCLHRIHRHNDGVHLATLDMHALKYCVSLFSSSTLLLQRGVPLTCLAPLRHEPLSLMPLTAAHLVTVQSSSTPTPTWSPLKARGRLCWHIY
jgi:hypothetical protein